MALHHEAAFSVLFGWMQSQAALLDRDSPEIPPLLRRAASTLQERPAMLRHFSEFFAETRATAVSRAFSTALTRGGPSGTPRPIEMHAHDPQRFVSDMLACIHQLAASEHELLVGLFEVAERRPAAQAVEKHASVIPVAVPEHQINTLALLDRILDGVTRSFKVRFEHVAATCSSAVVLFKLAQLLGFYQSTLGSLIGPDAALPSGLQSASTQCAALFLALAKTRGERLLRAPPTCPADLAPPPIVFDTVHMLAEVLAAAASPTAPILPLVSALVEPLLQACAISASGLSPMEMAVYLINCASPIHALLVQQNFAKVLCEMLAAQTEAHLETLVQEQSVMALRRCALYDKLALVQSAAPGCALSQVPGLDSVALADSIETFCATLAKGIPMPFCDRLVSAPNRTSARAQVATLIANAYSTLYHCVHNPANGYSNPASVASLSPEQVTALLH
eukprot:TRINITY_DN12729_c0_g2_i1.p1 TRINITY_DN12729_c0_g2~~TRINITY_DN12729_c0_g2_i1.p1  ORF type:complete len:528 (-),score=91.76 TRINITY_DN12729_c0_g2_i1:8-1360(-)